MAVAPASCSELTNSLSALSAELHSPDAGCCACDAVSGPTLDRRLLITSTASENCFSNSAPLELVVDLASVEKVSVVVVVVVVDVVDAVVLVGVDECVVAGVVKTDFLLSCVSCTSLLRRAVLMMFLGGSGAVILDALGRECPPFVAGVLVVCDDWCCGSEGSSVSGAHDLAVESQMHTFWRVSKTSPLGHCMGKTRPPGRQW